VRERERERERAVVEISEIFDRRRTCKKSEGDVAHSLERAVTVLFIPS
jgi:hypothetical protein